MENKLILFLILLLRQIYAQINFFLSDGPQNFQTGAYLPTTSIHYTTNNHAYISPDSTLIYIFNMGSSNNLLYSRYNITIDFSYQIRTFINNSYAISTNIFITFNNTHIRIHENNLKNLSILFSISNTSQHQICDVAFSKNSSNQKYGLLKNYISNYYELVYFGMGIIQIRPIIIPVSVNYYEMQIQNERLLLLFSSGILIHHANENMLFIQFIPFPFGASSTGYSANANYLVYYYDRSCFLADFYETYQIVHIFDAPELLIDIEIAVPYIFLSSTTKIYQYDLDILTFVYEYPTKSNYTGYKSFMNSNKYLIYYKPFPVKLIKFDYYYTGFYTNCVPSCNSCYSTYTYSKQNKNCLKNVTLPLNLLPLNLTSNITSNLTTLNITTLNLTNLTSVNLTTNQNNSTVNQTSSNTTNNTSNSTLNNLTLNSTVLNNTNLTSLNLTSVNLTSNFSLITNQTNSTLMNLTSNLTNILNLTLNTTNSINQTNLTSNLTLNTSSNLINLTDLNLTISVNSTNTSLMNFNSTNFTESNLSNLTNLTSNNISNLTQNFTNSSLSNQTSSSILSNQTSSSNLTNSTNYLINTTDSNTTNTSSNNINSTSNILNTTTNLNNDSQINTQSNLPNNILLNQTKDISTSNQVALTIFGRFLTLSSMKFNPKFLLSLTLFLDDLYYYRFHRNNYTQPVHYFMDKVEIINIVRFNPDYYFSFADSLKNDVVAIQEDKKYANLIPWYDNNPQKVYFVSSTENIYKQCLLVEVFTFILIKLLCLIFYVLSKACYIFSYPQKYLDKRTRFLSFLSSFVEANMAEIVFACGYQITQGFRLHYLDAFNMVFCILCLFFLFSYTIMFYPLIVMRRKKDSVEHLVVRSKLVLKGVKSESICIFLRVFFRTLIHATLINHYQTQMMLIVCMDILAVFLTFIFREGFLNRFIYFCMIAYYTMFLTLDTMFLVYWDYQQYLNLQKYNITIFVLIWTLIGLLLLVALRLLIRSLHRIWKKIITFKFNLNNSPQSNNQIKGGNNKIHNKQLKNSNHRMQNIKLKKEGSKNKNKRKGQNNCNPMDKKTKQLKTTSQLPEQNRSSQQKKQKKISSLQKIHRNKLKLRIKQQVTLKNQQLHVIFK